MKKLMLIIAVLFCVTIITAQAQDTITYPDTTMTKWKNNAVIVTIQTDSVTSTETMYMRKENNDVIKRTNSSIILMRAYKAFRLTIKAKMNEDE